MNNIYLLIISAMWYQSHLMAIFFMILVLEKEATNLPPTEPGVTGLQVTPVQKYGIDWTL